MKKLAVAMILGFAAFSAQARSDAAPEAASADADDTIVITSDSVAAKPTPETGCIRESGTRLKRRDAKGCTGAPGQSYSRAEIERTGANDTAEALGALSPRVSVRRGG